MKSREKSFWIVFYIIKSTDIYYVYIISKSDQQNRRTGMPVARKATYSASHFKVLCGMSVFVSSLTMVRRLTPGYIIPALVRTSSIHRHQHQTFSTSLQIYSTATE
jgi:hypothetical protein